MRHNKLPLTICRGWRPRQPTPPLTFRIIVYLTTLDNPTNIGRGEQRSPVLRTCRNFRIVGAGALDSPFGGGNAVIVITLMPIYFRGALLRYVPIIQWVKKISGHREHRPLHHTICADLTNNSYTFRIKML